MFDHFSRSELACPTTDQVRIATGFGEALERLRVELDEPIYLNSACRSPLHNAKINGHPQSLHLVINSLWTTGGTCAVDIAATDGQYRAKLITLALDQEWSVGVQRGPWTVGRVSCARRRPALCPRTFWVPWSVRCASCICFGQRLLGSGRMYPDVF